ncbi:BLUF domain-containing protein, partial [Stenotrophomonas sp. CFBP 13718]
MPIHAVVYASHVAAELPAERLDALVQDAARFNVIAGVTGLLLFDGERFLQYLEGPDDGLRAAYGRVLIAS